MYIDVHTYQKNQDKTDVLSVCNLNVPDHFCGCGLDLVNTTYSLGIHPWKINEQMLSRHLNYIEENASFDCVKAIGECGLDKLTETPWDLQLRAFESQIAISEKTKKPLLIHCVKAMEDLIALKKEIKPKQTWIIHGFRGKPEQMHQLINQGFYLSLGEFFNKETVRQMPLDKLFLETDDKYISIKRIYNHINQMLGMEIEQLIKQIESNYNIVFGD